MAVAAARSEGVSQLSQIHHTTSTLKLKSVILRWHRRLEGAAVRKLREYCGSSKQNKRRAEALTAERLRQHTQTESVRERMARLVAAKDVLSLPIRSMAFATHIAFLTWAEFCSRQASPELRLASKHARGQWVQDGAVSNG